jgi:hypothetical protein
MSDFDDMYGSQYLAATDLKKPITTVIEQVEEDDFAKQGERKKVKAVLHFRGIKKPMIVNKTNALVLAAAFGKNHLNDWPDQRVVIKSERTTFAGKPTMGLRIYPADGEEAPALKAQAPKKGKPSRDEMNDELPDEL